jgi:hypothetical protein
VFFCSAAIPFILSAPWREGRRLCFIRICPRTGKQNPGAQRPGKSVRVISVLTLAAMLVPAAWASPAGAQATGAAPATTPAATKPATGQSTAAKKKKKKAAQTRRQLTPEPSRIREIQGALAKEGYYKGEPTGKWDDASMEAMKQFQSAKGLPATGKLEALSLQKLGLGSPVAGLAPPEPRPSAAPPAGGTKPPQ